MNFQQLRAVLETARLGFNLTTAAQALHTSQPGVSRHIAELESELGVQVFVRAGKRLTGLTPPGEAVLPIVERLLLEARNLRSAGQEFASRDTGRLSIAATHSQARYALPHAVRDFRKLYPGVTLELHQGTPRQIVGMMMSGEADIAIATEGLAGQEQLVTVPTYRWTHVVITPPAHPLLEIAEPLTLEQLARYPLITYGSGYTGRSHIDEAFVKAGLQPHFVLSAMDADVIKTYVELEMGIGIVASVAFDAERDRNLRSVDARHLFEVNVTRVAIRRGAWLPQYAYDFIHTFSPNVDRASVEAAARSGAAAG